MEKKLVPVMLKSKAKAIALLLCVGCSMTYYCKPPVKQDYNAVESIPSKDTTVTKKFLSDTITSFAGERYSDTVRFDMAKINELFPLFSQENQIISLKGCAAKVALYQSLYQPDSVKNLYHVRACDFDLVFESIFGKNTVSRDFYLQGKRFNKKGVVKHKGLAPDSMNLQVEYGISHFYQVLTERRNYLFVVSKSEQWTGEMSNYNLYQLFDGKEQIVYELIEE